MNPPFHDARRHNVSPDARRRLAHVGEPGLLARWVATAAFLLKPGGILTLIWRGDERAGVIAALASEFGNMVVLPVAPSPGAQPIRILVRAQRGGGLEPVELPPLILNDAQGRPTQASEAVLREAQALPLAGGEAGGTPIA